MTDNDKQTNLLRLTNKNINNNYKSIKHRISPFDIISLATKYVASYSTVCLENIGKISSFNSQPELNYDLI